MAKNVIINGVSYPNVPSVKIPLVSDPSQFAIFSETSDATATASQMLSGATAYVNGTLVTGNIPSKSAQTYTPTTSDQTINSGQYLDGVQTIKGDANLVSSNIAQNVTIFGVTGSLSAATISQDSTTKVLSIS